MVQRGKAAVLGRQSFSTHQTFTSVFSHTSAIRNAAGPDVTAGECSGTFFSSSSSASGNIFDWWIEETINRWTDWKESLVAAPPTIKSLKSNQIKSGSPPKKNAEQNSWMKFVLSYGRISSSDMMPLRFHTVNLHQCLMLMDLQEKVLVQTTQKESGPNRSSNGFL